MSGQYHHHHHHPHHHPHPGGEAGVGGPGYVTYVQYDPATGQPIQMAGPPAAYGAPQPPQGYYQPQPQPMYYAEPQPQYQAQPQVQQMPQAAQQALAYGYVAPQPGQQQQQQRTAGQPPQPNNGGSDQSFGSTAAAAASTGMGLRTLAASSMPHAAPPPPPPGAMNLTTTRAPALVPPDHFQRVEDSVRSAGAAVAASSVGQDVSQAWGSVDSAFEAGRSDVASAFGTVASKAVSFCGEISQFEVIRDMLQVIGMVFALVASDTLAAAKAVWGNIAALVNVDWHYALPSVPTVIIIGAVGAIGLLLVIAFYAFARTASKLTPDSLREGNETQTWDELALQNSKTVKALQWTMRACTFAYLPVSKFALQILLCDTTVGLGLSEVDHAVSCTLGDAGHYDCNCSASGYYNWLRIFAVVLLLGFTVGLPIVCSRLIRKNVPRGSIDDPNIRYNADGDALPYTDQMYLQDMRTDPSQKACPYLFMYSSYTRKWCLYEVYIMLSKVVLCLLVLLLWARPGVQLIATGAVLAILALVSLAMTQFINPVSDRMDRVSRGTSFLLVLFAYIGSFGSLSHLMGVLVNVVLTVAMVMLVLMTLSALPAVRRLYKSLTGTLDFSNTVTGEVGSAGQIVPGWQMEKELKHRLWQEFWQALVSTLDAGTQKRFKDLLHVTTEYGLERIRAHFMESANPATLGIRQWVQQYLEGLDVYWPSDGQSGTNFGKMYVTPYPFHCTVVYDDTKAVCQVYGEAVDRMVQLAQTPRVVMMRRNRQVLRALDNQMVHFEHRQIETRTVADGYETVTDANGNKTERPRYSNVSVEMRYRYGQLRIKNHLSEFASLQHRWSAGFHVAIYYEDGEGVGVGPNTGQTTHFRNEHGVVQGEEFGCDANFGLDPSGEFLHHGFQKLVSHPENAARIQSVLPSLDAEVAEYRRNLMQQRAAAEAIMSDSFWLYVYDWYAKPRGELDQHLQMFERNPALQQLPTTHRQAFDYLYGRLARVHRNSSCMLWFVFWDDVWRNNRDLSALARASKVLDPRFPESVCYQPMAQSDLTHYLHSHVQGSNKLFKAATVGVLFASMGAGHVGVAVGSGNTVTSPLLANS